MSAGGPAPTLVLVTDPRYARADVERVVACAAAGLPRGALAVQLRDKASSRDALLESARALHAVCASVGAPFIVNAPTDAVVDIALEVGADGVHVPCRLDVLDSARRAFGAGGWISTPAHRDDEVAIAVGHATAVLVSPIFDSPDKGPARGLDALAAARTIAGRSGLRIYALGGVGVDGAEACARAGADGVAIIRALLDARDPEASARRLDAAFRR